MSLTFNVSFLLDSQLETIVAKTSHTLRSPLQNLSLQWKMILLTLLAIFLAVALRCRWIAFSCLVKAKLKERPINTMTLIDLSIHTVCNTYIGIIFGYILVYSSVWEPFKGGEVLCWTFFYARMLKDCYQVRLFFQNVKFCCTIAI